MLLMLRLKLLHASCKRPSEAVKDFPGPNCWYRLVGMMWECGRLPTLVANMPSLSASEHQMRAVSLATACACTHGMMQRSMLRFLQQERNRFKITRGLFRWRFKSVSSQ